MFCNYINGNNYWFGLLNTCRSQKVSPEILWPLEDRAHARSPPLVPCCDDLGLLGEAGDGGAGAQGLDRLAGEQGDVLLLLLLCVKLHLEVEILLRIC